MNRKLKNTALILIVVLAIVGVAGYAYLQQNHRNIHNEEAAFVTTPAKLHAEFTIGETASREKYLDKTIAVSGTISEMNETEITLEDKVFCQFSNKINEKQILNSSVKIKGRFIGYDDLLEQIKLDQCTIIIN